MARARVVKKFNYDTGSINYMVQRKVLNFWVDCDEYRTLKQATEVVYAIAGGDKALIDIENGKILDKDAEWFTIIVKESETDTKTTPEPPQTKRSGGVLA